MEDSVFQINKTHTQLKDFMQMKKANTLEKMLTCSASEAILWFGPILVPGGAMALLPRSEAGRKTKASGPEAYS